MKLLSKMHLIQFSFWDYETFNLKEGGTVFVGPNGAGKTSLIDALQIALIGAHGNFLQFNTQSVQKDSRTVRDYALGFMRSGEGDRGTLARKRDEALSYITLVFEGDRPQDVVSAGICIHSKASERGHRTLGMYVLPGVRLEQRNHLEVLKEGYFSPIDWNVFEASVRDMAKNAGREFTITSHPEIYLRELLHAIQGKGPGINHEVFLRALSQSLRLKGVNSVNDFIRENLLDAKPIDRQGTLRHIKTLQELSARIAEIREQIVQLDGIEASYTKLALLYRQRASARTVKLDFQIETADDRICELREQESTYNDLLIKLSNEISELEAEEDRYQKLERTLSEQIFSDPDAKDPEQTRQLKQARQETYKTMRRIIDRRTLDIREAMQLVLNIVEDKGHDLSPSLQESFAQWSDMAVKGQVPDAQSFADVLYQLGEMKEVIKTRLETANSAATAASAKLSNLTGNISAANKGMRTNNAGDLGRAMEILSGNGIESATVGSLVSVRDVSWQRAIESFLNRNRFALVVEQGRERDAVRILRNLKQELYDVTIVQPYHLRDSIGVDPEEHNVGALLIGDHPVALAYLRRILGRMRMVNTEEELERYERSLTKDGMLSANGGTRRIRLFNEEGDLVLGAKVSEAEKKRMHEDLMAAIRDDERARSEVSIIKRADEKLRALLQGSDHVVIRNELGELFSAKASYEVLPAESEMVVPEHLKQVMEQRDAASKAYQHANKTRMGKNQEVGDIQRSLKTLNENIDSELKVLTQLDLEHKDLLQDQDFDGDISVKIYSEISNLADTDGPEKALSHLYERYLNQDSRIGKLESDATTELKSFAKDRTLDTSDWRKSFEWVKTYKQRLVDSNLTSYQKQADEARDAANDAFHHDVALKLREAIHRIRQEIDDLNRILRSCPEFTGRERYHFDAPISSEFKWLHEMIETASYTENNSLQLFDAENDSSSKLAEFLQACESGENRGNNPLEDHRVLFNFDLNILVEGRTVDKLSKRLGVGSNGEHLIPFYVIAGATLVNAYRMKPGREHDGAALMIIDEAFHGFDAQNAYVTAQFLKSLGLQLVMAGPDKDIGNFVSTVDNYYDLWRYGADVDAEEYIVKEEGKKLMTSDIPDVNPGLVQQAILDMPT